MQINFHQTGFQATNGVKRSSDTTSSTDFDAILLQAVESMRESQTLQQQHQAPDLPDKQSRAEDTHDRDREHLLKLLRMNPIELMRYNLLREKGLTEESLAALPPEERDAIEQEIAQRIRELVEGEQLEGRARPL
ncbi:hypothetical protein [Nitrincola alkalilacustris]|uniref:hypothetical protein n=1 Tax=Nitrincola alkalilacustris TaxID=1571224 RepID=UPI00124D8B28|nr:hypothetical protein [Nitrincola alkalilacustris]